jgi:hypothetical protein
MGPVHRATDFAYFFPRQVSDQIEQMHSDLQQSPSPAVSLSMISPVVFDFDVTGQEQPLRSTETFLPGADSLNGGVKPQSLGRH